jgi:two-component system nitrate/nitrite response regulator NarL
VEETLKTAAVQPIDLILLDLYLASGTGLTLLEELPHTGFAGRVLVVAAIVGDEEAFQLACLGAAGIVLKTDPLERLPEAIRKVAAGELWFEQRFLKKILERTAQLARQNPTGAFTPREKAVLRHILNGLSNKEIAGQMNLPESSVKSAIQTLFHKTGVRSRSQLVRVALEQFHGEL